MTDERLEQIAGVVNPHPTSRDPAADDPSLHQAARELLDELVLCRGALVELHNATMADPYRQEVRIQYARLNRALVAVAVRMGW
jgi:hypothetical protein